jgi:hypothetical protein
VMLPETVRGALPGRRVPSNINAPCEAHPRERHTMNIADPMPDRADPCAG